MLKRSRFVLLEEKVSNPSQSVPLDKCSQAELGTSKDEHSKTKCHGHGCSNQVQSSICLVAMFTQVKGIEFHKWIVPLGVVWFSGVVMIHDFMSIVAHLELVSSGTASSLWSIILFALLDTLSWDELLCSDDMTRDDGGDGTQRVIKIVGPGHDR